MVQDVAQKVVVIEHVFLSHQLVLVDGLLAVVYPIRHGEVDGLVDVETSVETSMVHFRERDHELVRLLVHIVNADLGPKLLSHQRGNLVWGQESHQLMEQVWLFREIVWTQVMTNSLEHIAVSSRYTVPFFGGSHVTVIGTQGVVIFLVPAKGREHGTDV